MQKLSGRAKTFRTHKNFPDGNATKVFGPLLNALPHFCTRIERFAKVNHHHFDLGFIALLIHCFIYTQIGECYTRNVRNFYSFMIQIYEGAPLTTSESGCPWGNKESIKLSFMQQISENLIIITSKSVVHDVNHLIFCPLCNICLSIWISRVFDYHNFKVWFRMMSAIWRRWVSMLMYSGNLGANLSGCSINCSRYKQSYLIFVTGATGGTRVNFFARCKFLQI